MKRNKLRTLIVSAVFTLALLVVLLLNISPAEIAAAIASIPPLLILAGFGLHFFTYLLRTVVFKLFFDTENVSFGKLLRVHFIHNFYVHVVPASLGEVSFPVLLRQQIGMSKSFAVLVVSKILVFLFTVLLFFISIWAIFDFSQVLIGFSWLDAVLLVFGGVAFLLLLKFRHSIFLLLKRISFLKKGVEKIENFFQSIKLQVFRFKKISFAFPVLLLTLLSIFTIAVFYLLLLWGMQIELNFLEVLFVMSINVAFLVLPVKSIGGFGTTEGAWALGLMVIGVAKETAIGAGFAIHILALLNVVLLFVVGFLWQSLAKKKKNETLEE